jgi:superoxide dismutase, Cu-Zn family
LVKISLFGDDSIVGRSCVIHKNEDDLGKGGHADSLTTGNSGPRVACGVIGLTNEFKSLAPK